LFVKVDPPHWQCSCCGANNYYPENRRCFRCWKPFDRDYDKITEREEDGKSLQPMACARGYDNNADAPDGIGGHAPLSQA
jgi:hypothetical protein